MIICPMRSFINIATTRNTDREYRQRRLHCDSFLRIMHIENVHYWVSLNESHLMHRIECGDFTVLFFVCVDFRFIWRVIVTAALRTEISSAGLQSAIGCIWLLLHKSNYNTSIHLLLRIEWWIVEHTICGECAFHQTWRVRLSFRF